VKNVIKTKTKDQLVTDYKALFDYKVSWYWHWTSSIEWAVSHL